MQIELNRADFEKQTKELVKNLADLASKKEVEDAVYKALLEVAKLIKKKLKDKVPYDTGALYESFTTEKESNTAIQAGLDIAYAMYQEMGRRDEGEDPPYIIVNRPAGGETNYFKNTIDENLKNIFETFREEVLKNLYSEVL